MGGRLVTVLWEWSSSSGAAGGCCRELRGVVWAACGPVEVCAGSRDYTFRSSAAICLICGGVVEVLRHRPGIVLVVGLVILPTGPRSATDFGIPRAVSREYRWRSSETNLFLESTAVNTHSLVAKSSRRGVCVRNLCRDYGERVMMVDADAHGESKASAQEVGKHTCHDESLGSTSKTAVERHRPGS